MSEQTGFEQTFPMSTNGQRIVIIPQVPPPAPPSRANPMLDVNLAYDMVRNTDRSPTAETNPDQIPSDEPEEDEEDPLDLFADSTYKYLLYWDHQNGLDSTGEPQKYDYFHDLNGFILGWMCLITQWFLYSIMIDEAEELISDSKVAVVVRWGGNCRKPEELECPSKPPESHWSILAAIILGCFLLSDVAIALNGFFYARGRVSKASCLAVLGTSCYACWAGGVFAFQGAFNGSAYDAIVNCIGMLFINDLDEKVFLAYASIKDTKLFKKTFGRWHFRFFEGVKVSACMACACLLFVALAFVAGMVAFATSDFDYEFDSDWDWGGWWDTSNWDDSSYYGSSYWG